jgi:hypothetical protein
MFDKLLISLIFVMMDFMVMDIKMAMSANDRSQGRPVLLSQSVTSPKIICPDKLVDLAPLLLKDLPDYINREYLRRRNPENDNNTNLVLTVGNPDFRPIELSSQEYRSIYPQQTPQQLFITTLERQSVNGRTMDLQLFHWVFLQRHQNKWHLISVYTRKEISQKVLVSPPEDATKTAIAFAIDRWLSDCNTNSLRSSSGFLHHV